MIKAADKSGVALTKVNVTLALLSSANTDADMHMDLPETSDGVYSKDIALPLYGEWSILVTLTKNDDVHVIKGTIEVDPEN
jgi:hypothetical protein